MFDRIGLMFDGLDRSIGLLKASGAILLKDRRLLAFPVISTLAAILVMASFALPLGGVQALQVLSGRGTALTPLQYLTSFLFYLSLYFVIFFFNTALVGAAMMQLDGQMPSVRDGLRIALSRITSILGYALIAATVGMVLRVIQDRFGLLGRLIAGLLGVGWTLATFLVVPVLAARDVGPVEAVMESAELFKSTWREGVIGQSGLAVAFTLIYLGEIACGAVLISLASALQSTSLTVLMEIVVIGAVVLTALVNSALSGIYAAALYRYATDSGDTPGFEDRALERAFLAGY